MGENADRGVVYAGFAVQNKITRSCALSSVVGFAMAYSRHQLFANAATAARRIGS